MKDEDFKPGYTKRRYASRDPNLGIIKEGRCDYCRKKGVVKLVFECPRPPVMLEYPKYDPKQLGAGCDLYEFGNCRMGYWVPWRYIDEVKEGKF